MGNKCCGNRNKPEQNQEKSSEYTTKHTTKDESFTKDPATKSSTKVSSTTKERKGACPYCKTLIPIITNLKYLECPSCKEKSLQDGCTTTLYP